MTAHRNSRRIEATVASAPAPGRETRSPAEEAWLDGWNKGWDAALEDERAELRELHSRLYVAEWENDRVREGLQRLTKQAMGRVVGETCWLILAASALALLVAIFWGGRP